MAAQVIFISWLLFLSIRSVEPISIKFDLYTDVSGIYRMEVQGDVTLSVCICGTLAEI